MEHLTFKKQVKYLLKKYQVRPLKRLGQNFLIDRIVLGRIIKAANISPRDTILEIGPGLGVLTQELAKKAKQVVAVEKDPKMIEILKETLKDFKNVEIIQEDILKSNIQELISNAQYKVVANLPYYIVSPIIRQFLEYAQVGPLQMILMVQKEVAQRICENPPRMNLLAVSVQFYAKPEIVSYISKKSFWPQPKVDGAILKISNLKSQISKIDKDLFFKIVKAGFLHPRKQILNNLSEGLALSLPNELKLNKPRVKTWLLKNKISPLQRAETLSIEAWINLTKSFKN